MGIHYTRPSLQPAILGKIQKIAASAVHSSPLASPRRLELFALEASCWVHTAWAQQPSVVFSTVPWQRGAALFLDTSDVGAAMGSSVQTWAAFYRPSLTYAACRGALCAWPELWSRSTPELRLALSKIDVHSLEDWVEALTVVVGSLAWSALTGKSSEKVKGGNLFGEIKRQCNNYGLTSRIVHGVPSRSEEAEALQMEATVFLQAAISSAAQAHARHVFSNFAECPGGLGPRPRPRRPRSMVDSNATAQPAGCVGVVPARWLLSACYMTSPFGGQHGEIRPSDPCTADGEEIITREGQPCTAPENLLKCLKWREAIGAPRFRSFYKLSDLPGAIADVVTHENIRFIVEEFDTLWRNFPQDFLPWQEHGEPVMGWQLLGTHLFGQRLEGNCRRAPQAAALAEAVGATLCGYSVLQPGTHIEPHAEDHGSSATRLHIPLRVPRGGLCGLSVASQVRVWEEGVPLAFDSTCQHEAWNFSHEFRAVLLLDFGAASLPRQQWPRWLVEQLSESQQVPSPGHAIGALVVGGANEFGANDSDHGGHFDVVTDLL